MHEVFVVAAILAALFWPWWIWWMLQMLTRRPEEEERRARVEAAIRAHRSDAMVFHAWQVVFCSNGVPRTVAVADQLRDTPEEVATRVAAVLNEGGGWSRFNGVQVDADLVLDERERQLALYRRPVHARSS